MKNGGSAKRFERKSARLPSKNRTQSYYLTSKELLKENSNHTISYEIGPNEP